MSDEEDGGDLTIELLDLVEYMRALTAEEKRCQHLDKVQMVPTQLFRSLLNRVETVWAGVEQRLQTSTGLPVEIKHIYDDAHRLVGFDIVLSFRPDKNPTET